MKSRTRMVLSLAMAAPALLGTAGCVGQTPAPAPVQQDYVGPRAVEESPAAGTADGKNDDVEAPVPDTGVVTGEVTGEE